MRGGEVSREFDMAKARLERRRKRYFSISWGEKQRVDRSSVSLGATEAYNCATTFDNLSSRVVRFENVNTKRYGRAGQLLKGFYFWRFF